MPTIIETLPEVIQDILFSKSYRDFLSNLQKEFGLSNEQIQTLDNGCIWNLFKTHGKSLSSLVQSIQQVLNTDEETSKSIARRIILNTVLVFPEFFGDNKKFYESIGGGKVEEDLMESFTYNTLLKDIFNGMLQYIDGALDVDPEQEMRDMNALFQKNLIDLLYVHDDEFVEKLNNTLFILFGTVENCSRQLLHALDENHEWLGAEKILLDNKEVEPTAAHWIKSFLGESNGEVSTISIPKYLSTSTNTKNLSDLDRGALVKLLETFRVLHTFPRSFENLDPEQWMVIPYRQEEKPIAHTVGQLASLPVDQSKNTKDEPKISEQTVQVKVSAQQAPLPTIPPQRDPAKAVTNYQLPTQDQKLQTNDQSMLIDNDILTQADVIIKETGVNALNWERFRKLLASYLKGLRNDLDTKDRLKAPESEGGIGLSQEDADKVMKKAKEVKNQLASLPVGQLVSKQTENATNSSNTSDSFGRSRLNDQLKIKNEKLIIPEVKLPTNDTVPANLPVVQPPMPLLVIEDVDGLPTLVQKTVGKSASLPVDQSKNTKIESGIMNPSTRASSVLGKQESGEKNTKQETSTKNESGVMSQELGKKTQDTKPSHAARFSIPLKVNIGIPQSSSQKDTQSIAGVKRPQVLDPVEELHAMTLQDFRRLSQDPKEAVQKVYQKIMLLEKESFTKKTAGLENWRDNEVNKLYLQMGRESFGKGVSMQEVIEQRKKVGQDFLVEPEFDALLELNGLLRS